MYNVLMSIFIRMSKIVYGHKNDDNNPVVS